MSNSTIFDKYQALMALEEVAPKMMELSYPAFRAVMCTLIEQYAANHETDCLDIITEFYELLHETCAIFGAPKKVDKFVEIIDLTTPPDES